MHRGGRGLPHVSNSEKEDYDPCDGYSQGTPTAACKDSKIGTVGGIVAPNPTVIKLCSIGTSNCGYKQRKMIKYRIHIHVRMCTISTDVIVFVNFYWRLTNHSKQH